MNLYLMRHADAGLPRGNPTLDARRSLIKDGKDQCILMAALLSAFKVQVDVILSSPLKRSLQTAQFVGTELGYEGKVEVCPALGMDATYVDFQRLLAKYADREGVLAVGHNPNLFQFLGRLVTGNGGANLRVRKGEPLIT
jgi:phosphohistidine phosphatase